MREVLVSVIIPVYNSKQYIRELLSDILNQTYKNLEIIIVDDGSTDNSLEIINEFAQNDNRICVITTENRGPSAARNTGLDKAKGTYIRFIDADDRVLPNSINEMVKAYKENEEIDLVIGNYRSIPSKYLVTGKKLENKVVKEEQFIDIFIEHIRAFYIGVPWNKLYKRAIIEKYKIRFHKDIMWSEDFLFNLDYFDKCKSFYLLFVDEGIYDYYLRESSITHALEDNIEHSVLDEIEKMRYESAKKYCMKHNRIETFELEWRYSYTYAELTVLARNNKEDNFLERYRKFKLKLMDPNIYEYISMKAKNTDIRIWRLLEELTRRKMYRSTFILFILKEYMVNNMQTITKAIKKIINHNMPSNL
ncbi:MAG: glycosyltransferase [Lachnospiraceae bacterium]|nr:glycosyltransferase [Lachnospiraceae bacterium]